MVFSAHLGASLLLRNGELCVMTCPLKRTDFSSNNHYSQISAEHEDRGSFIFPIFIRNLKVLLSVWQSTKKRPWVALAHQKAAARFRDPWGGVEAN